MTNYEVTQRIIPSVYPSIHLFTSATKIVDDEEYETIYTKRELADWASFTKASVGPTIAFTLGLCETVNVDAWNEEFETVRGTLWAYIRNIATGDEDINTYSLESSFFIAAANLLNSSRVIIISISSSHGMKP